MPDPAPIPQELSDRYAVVSEIGRGGSSIVYRATDRATGREVAIKLLRPEFAQTIDAARFLNEAQLAGALLHPAIVPILDRGEAGGQPYFVLPFLEGGTLRDRLRSVRQLPVQTVVAITTRVAEALAHAHAHHVIHRDVKPENILFTGGTAFLADFGIARALEHAMGEATTTTGVVRGTPAYMSPEQAAGEKELDARTDVYSLGCVVYEMLAGMPAFSGPTQQSVMAQRITHGPRPLAVYRPMVPSAMQQVIDRALTAAPADRWQSVTEFANALRDAAAAPPQSAVPAASARRWRGAARMLGAAAAVAVGAALALPWARRFGSGPRGSLSGDATVIAIIPFAATTPIDSIVQTGLVDVLARGFDGAGPLRAVPPSVVYSTWQARSADTVTAAEFARRVGANVVLFGVIGQWGRDSVQVSATLFDAAARRVLDEITVLDAEVYFLRLADSLTTRALRRLAADRPIAAVRGGSFATTALPALKAFLRGEQYLRHNEYAPAESAYRAAVRADSTFALGWRRMRAVRRGLFGETDDSSFTYALRAGALNRGLSPRDSLLIRADSLLAALPRRLAVLDDPGAHALMWQRLRVLETATSRYPEDAEAWEELGELRHHFGDRLGIVPDSALVAFERAIQADSNYLPPYYHAVELSFGLRTPAEALALVSARQQRSPTAPGYAIAEALARQRIAAADGDLTIPRALAPIELRRAASLTLRWADRTPVALHLFRAVLDWTPPADAATLRGETSTFLAYDLLYRGRMRETRPLLTGAFLDAAPHLVPYVMMLDTARRAELLSACRSWSDAPAIERLLAAQACAAHARDTALLRKVQHRLATLTTAPDPATMVAARFGVAFSRFHLAVAAARSRADSLAAATAAADAYPDSLCTWRCAPERGALVDVLLGVGESGAAARLLDAHPPSASRRQVSEVLWHAARARAAAALGDRDAATRSAAFVERAWVAADVVPRGIRDDVRRTVAGLRR